MLGTPKRSRGEDDDYDEADSQRARYDDEGDCSEDAGNDSNLPIGSQSENFMSQMDNPTPAAQRGLYLGQKQVQDRVHGQITLDRLLLLVMDTPDFQRLDNIKQLGGCSYIYPSATHTRKEHSIGVCHLAGLMVKHLRTAQPTLGIDDDDELCVKLAGLVHDIGHGPFSHMFEEFVHAAGHAAKEASSSTFSDGDRAALLEVMRAIGDPFVRYGALYARPDWTSEWDAVRERQPTFAETSDQELYEQYSIEYKIKYTHEDMSKTLLCHLVDDNKRIDLDDHFHGSPGAWRAWTLHARAACTRYAPLYARCMHAAQARSSSTSCCCSSRGSTTRTLGRPTLGAARISASCSTSSATSATASTSTSSTTWCASSLAALHRSPSPALPRPLPPSPTLSRPLPPSPPREPEVKLSSPLPGPQVRDAMSAFGSSKPPAFDIYRTIHSSRVLCRRDPERPGCFTPGQVCFQQKVMLDINEVYTLRARLHQYVYQHHIANVAEGMIVDLLRSAGSFEFRGSDGQVSTLEDAVHAPASFITLTDSILETIAASPAAGLERARHLMNRLKSRDFYMPVSGQAKLYVPCECTAVHTEQTPHVHVHVPHPLQHAVMHVLSCMWHACSMHVACACTTARWVATSCFARCHSASGAAKTPSLPGSPAPSAAIAQRSANWPRIPPRACRRGRPRLRRRASRSWLRPRSRRPMATIA